MLKSITLKCSDVQLPFFVFCERESQNTMGHIKELWKGIKEQVDNKDEKVELADRRDC